MMDLQTMETEWLASKQRIAALEAEVAELKTELERERIRLAACGTAALGYYNGCNDEYKSASLDDVLRLRKDAERYRWIRNNDYLSVMDNAKWEYLDAAIDAAIKEAQS